MLERETQQRQAVQAQLTQEQAKCALLEQEILQASHAAHEMGESLRQYFSQTGSECSDATTATMQAWAAALTGSACPSAEPSLAGDTPRAASKRYYASTASKEPLPASMQQLTRHDTSAACDQALMSTNATAPGQLPQHNSSKRSSSRIGTDPHQKASRSHQQQRKAMQTPQEHQIPRSSCSSGHAALRCSSQLSAATELSPLLSKQPTLGRGDTARMQRHVLQVADQLKGLAISWQQRLDNSELPPCSSPTKPALITISAAVAAAASGGMGASSATQGLRPAPAGAAAAANTAAGAATGRPAGDSQDWASSSFQSSATAMCAHDPNASCDLSSSTSSFVRYRSNQAAYGESPADIDEGDEEGDEEGSVEQQGDGSDGCVLCETDEEAEAAQLRWHVQQLEQQQQAQQRQLPSHSQLQQHAQQQVLAKHAQWQQQQQVELGSWARPAQGAVVPGCAITRGAASRGVAPVADSSSNATQQGTPGAVSGASVARSPLAAGASAGNTGKSLPPAPRMVPQQQLPAQQQQQGQQHNMQGYTPAPASWQQHSSPFPSLSGTSCSGTPAVQQQQHSLRGAAAAGTGVEHIPQELKFMAPLRRHQQYLGTT
jgi:hypothetical protein